MKTLPKIFNLVWFMLNNKITKAQVTQVKQTASRNNTEIHSIITIKLNDADDIRLNLVDIFETKESLIKNLFGISTPNTSQADQCCISIFKNFDNTEILKEAMFIKLAWKMGRELMSENKETQ